MVSQCTTASIPELAVRAAFEAFPVTHRSSALALRAGIIGAAERLSDLGGLVETLKWGEPAYLPARPRIGTTVRIACHDESHIGLMFNCQTLLVERFRCRYGDTLCYTKNRGVLFAVAAPIPEPLVEQCVVAALHYHRDKR